MRRKFPARLRARQTAHAGRGGKLRKEMRADKTRGAGDQDHGFTRA